MICLRGFNLHQWQAESVYGGLKSTMQIQNP